MTTWRKELTMAMKPQESFDDVEYTTLTKEELDREFDDGFGAIEGGLFLLWTKTRVYFPACYDGSEWVGSVPRNPCEEDMHHMGGG